jgi:hypothetical protein
MTTVVDFTEEEMAELKAATQQTDASAAVRIATTEYLRLVRRLQLKDLSGRVSMDDNWQVLEAAEIPILM